MDYCHPASVIGFGSERRNSAASEIHLRLHTYVRFFKHSDPIPIPRPSGSHPDFTNRQTVADRLKNPEERRALIQKISPKGNPMEVVRQFGRLMTDPEDENPSFQGFLENVVKKRLRDMPADDEMFLQVYLDELIFVLECEAHYYNHDYGSSAWRGWYLNL